MSARIQRTIVVTGASRGLGLEWVKQFSIDSDSLVIAVLRNPQKADGIHQLDRSNIVIVQGDLSKIDTFPTIVSDIAAATGNKVDVLVNNAAVMVGASTDINLGISKSSPAEWDEHFHVNVTSLVFFTIAMIPLLERGSEKKVVNISSFFADIEWTTAHPEMHNASYAVSKAAATLATIKFHNEFKEKGFVFIALNPGWVATDMGSSLAPLKPEESIRRCLAFVNRAEKGDGGRFFTLDGMSQASAS